MTDFLDDMPEAELTEAQMASRYTELGGFCYDPVKGAFRYSYQKKEWYRTLDNVDAGQCTIAASEFAVWNVTLWYRKTPKSNYVCIEGNRESVGFFVLSQEICRVERELVTTKTWTEWLPLHEPVRQRFVYLYADGSDPDSIWRDIPE